MRKRFSGGVAVLLSALVLSSALLCRADTQNTAPQQTAPDSATADAGDYEAYRTAAAFPDAAAALSLPLDRFTAADGDATFAAGVLEFGGTDGSVSFPVTVPDAALYELQIVWKPKTAGINPNLGVRLDGAFPFSNAAQIELKREWKNGAEAFHTDGAGNEYAGEQVETGEFITSVLQDFTGFYPDPYLFALAAGDHTLTLTCPDQAILVREIKLLPPERPASYADVIAQKQPTETDAEIIKIQAEDAAVKNSKSLLAKSNNSDPGMTPSDPHTSRINYIGGSAWQSPGSRMTWSVQVPTDGYYALTFRYKQSELVNGVSYRKLRVDGEVPFAEAAAIGFEFGTRWKYQTLAGDDAPYYLFLTKGEHTLSLEVTSGRQSDILRRLSAVVNRLGDEYIKIVMITGESPDVNRDYELFRQIKDFNQTLTECKDALDGIAADLRQMSGKKSTQSIAAMDNMSRVLRQMLKSPYVAQQYVKDYYNNYTAVSSWLYDMTNMPLSLDEIQLVPCGQSPERKKANFFKSLSYGFVRLLSSFSRDYRSAEGDGAQIRIWINWGQDQAMVLDSLIADSFTPKTGIRVRLEVVNASLINGILSGNYPDLSLQMARTEPVNLGMRGALYDLTQFSDCDEVLQRFQQTADEPYRYKNALYALPDTQSFFLMYYRTDILEKLGLSAPQTWDEFKHAAMVIQRNNMNVYVPYTQITTSTTVNTGIGSLNLYPTLMAQSGLSLYNAQKTATAIDTNEAIEVFNTWTGLYTEYGYLKEAEFYNRFRVGVVPLGIAPLATYMNLYSAAPEIAGRWAVGLVPASANGNRNVAGAGTGCGIINLSDHKAEAWEFLKWWTSAETQTRYNNNVEAILGMIGRTTTANVEAFGNLAWDPAHLSVMEAQRLQVREVPEVPGSYYLSRAIDQAFWTVVNGESNAKDAVMKWSKVADDEIDRKIREYS